MVEVMLALVLALFSGALLLGGLALMVVAFVELAAIVARYSPGLVVALAAGSGALLAKSLGVVTRAIWKVLSAIWSPFLKYYRYEPHTLRPIGDETDRDVG